MESRFSAVRQAAASIEGMLSEFSIAVMDSVLAFQTQQGIVGTVIEFGVYKGRSAAVLASHLAPSERLILVDVHDYVEHAKLRAMAPTFEFVLSSSEDFSKRFGAYRTLLGKCRTLHVDSSHGFRTTLRELEMANELVADDGIVILDDFTNLNYSQILAATYKYLYTSQTSLTVFLVTDEKAYLCKRPAFERYGKFALTHLVDEMAARGSPTTLARTDADPEYRAFYLRGRSATEGRFYGEEIYKGYYRSP